MKAVIWTDVFQAIVMIIGFLSLTIKGSAQLGGFAQVWNICAENGRLNLGQWVSYSMFSKATHLVISVLRISCINSQLFDQLIKIIFYFEFLKTTPFFEPPISLCSFQLDPRYRNTFWTIIVGGSFLWISIYAVHQAQVQRYLSCKTLNQAKG